MTKLRPILNKLRATREKFEAAGRGIREANWRTPPSAGRWSAAEVVAHVTMVETLITGAMTNLTRKPLVRVPLLRRLHIPIALAAWRTIRVESPIPLDTMLLDDREPMLARLAEQRLHTLAALESGSDQDFRQYRLRHPFLGSLNYYQWFRTLAAHDARHSKQLREIAAVHKNP